MRVYVYRMRWYEMDFSHLESWNLETIYLTTVLYMGEGPKYARIRESGAHLLVRRPVSPKVH